MDQTTAELQMSAKVFIAAWTRSSTAKSTSKLLSQNLQLSRRKWSPKKLHLSRSIFSIKIQLLQTKNQSKSLIDCAWQQFTKKFEFSASLITMNSWSTSRNTLSILAEKEETFSWTIILTLELFLTLMNNYTVCLNDFPNKLFSKKSTFVSLIFWKKICLSKIFNF